MQNSTSKTQWSFAAALAASLMLLAAGCKTDSSSSSSKSAAAPAPKAATTSSSTTAAAPAMAATPAAPAMAAGMPIRIVAGSATAFTNRATKEVWSAPGSYFADGDTIERPGIPIVCADTNISDIYRSERYSMTKFTCPVPNGKYMVKLHFCETYDGITSAGTRVFSFNVCGKDFKNLDLFAKAGFEHEYIETVPVTITNGKVEITFTAVAENPQINGVEILPGS